MLQTLHLGFETQYSELALAVDLIAERIRALGVAAPGTYRRVADPPTCDLLTQRMQVHEKTARMLRSLLE